MRLSGLYPAPAELAALFEKDNAVFRGAPAKLGYQQVGGEPIAVTCALFLKDRGLSDARQQRGETDAVFGAD